MVTQTPAAGDEGSPEVLHAAGAVPRKGSALPIIRTVALDGSAAQAGNGLPRAPSMADVAARAGVSSQTVSRVSTGADKVRPETRRRVLAALFGAYPSSAIAAGTRRRAPGRTLSAPVETRETVCDETPARAATSAMEGAREGAKPARATGPSSATVRIMGTSAPPTDASPAARRHRWTRNGRDGCLRNHTVIRGTNGAP